MASFANSRRAMSLLEAVFATVLLALITVAVTGVVANLNAAEIRARKRLGAYEIANRLLLQHLDDPEQLPSDALAVEYDRYRYRWELSEGSVRMDLPRVPGDQGRSREPVQQALERFRLVNVKVWAVDEQRPGDQHGEQLAYLERLYDPFAPRNPDAVDRWTQERIMRLLEGLTGGQSIPASGGRGSGPSPQNRDGAPRQ